MSIRSLLGFLVILFSLLTTHLGAMPPHPDLYDRLTPKGRQELAQRYQRVASRTSASPQRVFPSSGNRKIIVLLVGYSDLALNPVSTQSFYSDLLNGASPAALSMRKYYQDMSDGALNLTIDVFGPYQAPKAHAYYGANGGSGFTDSHPAELVGFAIDQAEAAGVDFSDYDNDHDGEVDVVMVIHAGRGEESSDQEDDIWSHAWDLVSAKSYGDGAGQRIYDGKRIKRYTIQPEYNDSAGDSTIGVFCHEFGHILGLPDLYDTSGETYGVGRYSLMALGSWLGTPSGARPAPLLAWEKYQLGWISLKLPDGSLVGGTPAPNETLGFRETLLARGASKNESGTLFSLLALGVFGLGLSLRRKNLREILLPLLTLCLLPGWLVFLASCGDDDDTGSGLSSSSISLIDDFSSSASLSASDSSASLEDSSSSVPASSSKSASSSTAASGFALPYEQNFNQSTTIPSGWSMVSGSWASYSGDYAVGKAGNSIKLDGAKTIRLPYFNQEVLSLELEGYYNVASGGKSPLKIQYKVGAAWQDLTTITDFPSRAGWDDNLRPASKKVVNLPANVREIQLVFSKSTGNLSLDNIVARATPASSASSSSSVPALSSKSSSSSASSSSKSLSSSSSSSSSKSSASGSSFSAHAITVNGDWVVGEVLVADGEVWFEFDAVGGTSYAIFWDDGWVGSGNYDLISTVSCYQADRVTGYFVQVDEAYFTPRYITPSASGKIYLQVETYGDPGTIAFKVTTEAPPLVSLEDIETGRVALKISLGDKQYYLVENKVRVAGTWTEYLPGDGLLITQIHEGVIDQYLTKNEVNDTKTRIHGVAIIEADNNNSLWVKTSQGQAGDLFKDRSFTPTTTPATLRYTATADPWKLETVASGIHLENISPVGAVMSFNYYSE